MLTKEELLKPRIKIIAAWPGMEEDDYEVGQIHAGEEKDLNIKMIEEFPHLFKRLEWWEERELPQLPEYIKFPGNDIHPYFYFRIETWQFDGKSLMPQAKIKNGNWMVITHAQPATEEEYNSFRETQYKTK